jgi:hypothetical protein
MIHVVAMKCLIGLPLLYILSVMKELGVLVLKIEEPASAELGTDSTALVKPH